MVYSAVHVDDKFIGEAPLAVFKKVSEVYLKVFENCVHHVCLHFRRDLLIEVEFFNNQVEIVQESVLHVLLNITVEVWRYIIRFVRLFDLFNPDVK